MRWWSFRLSAPGEIEAANGPYRGKKGTVLVGLGGYQMFDSLAIDRDGALQLTGELLTLRSGQRAAAAERPLAMKPQRISCASGTVAAYAQTPGRSSR